MCFLFSLTFVSALSFADEIDDFVSEERKRQKIPGISVLVVENGEVIKMRGYGLANVEHKVPVTAETIFQSGSVGKQFTAAGILLLQEDGKLEFDDPLSQHFTDAPESWDGITIRHLLTHTSGLEAYDSKVDFRKDYTEEELLKVMMGLSFYFEPGQEWRYSNSGYVVLGILISKLTGAHWGEYLEERVFKPAGMNTARVISERDIVLNRSAGYHREKGKLLNQGWVSQTWLSTGDGALYFSIKDLAAWAEALRQRKLFSEASYQAWWTSGTLNSGITHNYGFGWMLDELRGQPVIGHGGAWQGFRTTISRYVKQDLTVAVLANATVARPSKFAEEIAGMLHEDLALPDPNEPGKDPDPDRTESLKQVVAAWAAAEVHERMAPRFAEVDPENPSWPHRRKYFTKKLEEAKGFYWLLDASVESDSLFRLGENIRKISYYTLKTEKESIRLRFYLNEEGRVAMFAEG